MYPPFRESLAIIDWNCDFGCSGSDSAGCSGFGSDCFGFGCSDSGCFGFGCSDSDCFGFGCSDFDCFDSCFGCCFA